MAEEVLLEIADKSFGIYLVHMLFVNFEYKLLSLNPFEDGLYIGFVLIIFNIILSYCCTWVLKKYHLFENLFNLYSNMFGG